MLSLKRLSVFREVARQGSFSLAAEALSYSQPAVSHHVTSLEREIGAKLLERGSRGELHLTKVGAVVLAQAEGLLDAAEGAERQITTSIEAGNRETKLGVTGGAPIVADAIVRFRKSSPDAQLRLFEGNRTDMIAALRARELDVGLVVEDPADPIPPDARFVSEPLYDDPILLVLPRGHSAAVSETVSVADLAGETWIDRNVDATPWAVRRPGDMPPFSPLLKMVCREAGFEPRIALATINPLYVQRLVAARVGIALLSELALAEPHPQVVIRRIDPPRIRRLTLATVPASLSSNNLVALAEALRATCRRYAAVQPRRLAELLTHDTPASGHHARIGAPLLPVKSAATSGRSRAPAV